MRYLNFVQGLLCILLIGSATHAVTIDTVPVGNVGNPADTTVMSDGTTGYGSVGYAYRIGTTEVTVGQYAAFLNAVAATDTYALYFSQMGTDPNIAGIARSGSSGTYTYSPIGSANKPISYVNWGDAARFCNWLNNGQPTGLQDSSTTEDGAYALNGAVTNAALIAVTRKAGAQWFIPTENEWYKAAYHKNNGPTSDYWSYPTGTNNEPNSDQPPGDPSIQTNGGNFYRDDALANGYNDGFAVTGSTPFDSNQNYLTDAGAYAFATSPYGTFDQGGNVYEWNETLILGVTRGFRGGDYSLRSPVVQSSSRSFRSPTNKTGASAQGFRVASTAVPEPSTLLLLCFGSLAVLWRRRGLLCAAILVAAVGATFADRANADTFGSGANTFNIDFVNIGNPGNAADTTGNPNPAGSVPYTFRMGQFEVSRDMITKANALGNLGITLNDMTPYGGNGVNRPATGVSWNEAARFVNWLNTSNGSTPAYKFAIQPGEAGYSANASIQLWTPSDAGYDPNNFYRNSLARYFLPSVHEWYKAAYFDPTSGDYYDYPTGSDSAPTAVATGTAAGTAVYNGQSGPADITQAGGLSPYGIMGMGGNVFEWEETAFNLLNNSTSSPRGVRGGGWILDSSDLLSSTWGGTESSGAGVIIGFRVASSIPEPSTLLLLCFGSLAVLWRRRTLR